VHAGTIPGAHLLPPMAKQLPRKMKSPSTIAARNRSEGNQQSQRETACNSLLSATRTPTPHNPAQKPTKSLVLVPVFYKDEKEFKSQEKEALLTSQRAT